MNFANIIFRECGTSYLRLEISHDGDPAFLRIEKELSGSATGNYTLSAFIEGASLTLEGILFEPSESFYSQLAVIGITSGEAELTADFPSTQLRLNVVHESKRSRLLYAIEFAILPTHSDRLYHSPPTSRFTGEVEIERTDVRCLLPSFRFLLETKNAEQTRPANPRPFGTSVMAPAGSASRAGATPGIPDEGRSAEI